MNKTWQEHVALAEHYKAIGQTRISLMQAGEKPWGYVTHIEAGGMWRFNTPVSFRVDASVGGLDFFWYEDIERPGSNATASLNVNKEYLLSIIEKLPPERAAELNAVFESVKTELRKQIEQSRKYLHEVEDSLAFLEGVSA